MTRKRTDIDIDHLVKMYTDGQSVKALSKHFRIARSGISRRLIESGISPRGRSEANVLRMRNFGPERRMEIVRKAHIARHLKGDSPETIKARTWARAISNAGKAWLVGAGESDIFDALQNAGLCPVAQFPVEAYNLDIACAPVAVEVWTISTNPLKDKRCRKRTKKLLELGWSVLYIWGKPNQIERTTADKIIAIIQEARSNPTARGQYWVIRRNGDALPEFSGNIDNLT